MGYTLTRINRHVACEEINMLWDEPEVEAFTNMYKAGKSISFMAKYFRRHKSEVIALALDQLPPPAFRHLITKRWD